jgi:hypothetical protein
LLDPGQPGPQPFQYAPEPDGPPAVSPDQTQRIPRVRTTGGSTHELFGWYVVHADDELVLQEIADSMASHLTQQAAGRAHVRKKNAGFDPIRTITGGNP